MAALTTDRNTPRKLLGRMVAYPVKAATKIYAGSIVAVEAATGFAVPAADTAGHQVVGIADEQIDNTGGASGAVDVRVLKGTFKVNNNVANPIIPATVGDVPQIADDNTIRASGATNAITVGIVDRLEADGVWITIA